MNLPNARTPCLIIAEGLNGTVACAYADGVDRMQDLGKYGMAATLMTVKPAGEFLLQTLAERRYFADGGPS